MGADIVIPGPGSRRSSECSTAAAVTMRHDVVARLEASIDQKITQLLGRLQAAGVE